MARKTLREDDIVLVCTENHIASGLTTTGQILDAYHMPRKGMKKLFDEKQVLLNGKKTHPQDAVKVNDEIRLQMLKEKIDYEPIEMPLHILYEDMDLLIVDKPVGMTVNSSGQVSLANGIAHYFKEQGIKRKVRFLNRLDRDTSGCIVISKSHISQSFYQGQIENGTFEKWYSASIEGDLRQVNGQIVNKLAQVEGLEKPVLLSADGKALSGPLEKGKEYILELPMQASSDGIHQEVHKKGKLTRTGFLIGQVSDVDTQVDIRLYTGKTHQIRLAFSYLGHPLLNDALYGSQAGGQYFALRALQVVFTHMRTGERISIQA